MSHTVISVENISKYYRLGLIGGGTLRADFERWWAKVRGKPDPLLKIGQAEQSNRQDEYIWALRDVSFEVNEGEVLGIIGRNGAGKSTLLKILSRVTAPTAGEVKVKGRVASLLEVGTGFHPELTGRENIYLNGAILGMKRTEIKRKYDEIVAFSEVERFIDTPVKRYSSGMYVRLAFAVAAHLEPEILIIDEVLAVGDAAFQKKCLGKMGDVAEEGRTVLFVSHNMGAVSQLCAKGVLLELGEVKDIGGADDVVRHYLATGVVDQESIDLTDYRFRKGSQDARFEWAQLRDSEQKPNRHFSIGDDITIVFGMKSTEKYLNQKVKVAVELRSSDGIQLCNMVDTDSGFQIEHLRQTEVVSVCMKDIRLYPDSYYASLWVGSVTSTETFDYVEDCLNFEIINGGKLTMRSLPRRAGLLFLTPEWKLEGNAELIDAGRNLSLESMRIE